MSMSLASAILLAATVMNAEAESLPFYDPPPAWWPSYSYAFKGASSIVREQEEKLLLMNAEPPGSRALRVIVLVNKEYGTVREILSGLIKDKWGILQEQNNSMEPIPKLSANMGGEGRVWPVLGEGLSYLSNTTPTHVPQEDQIVTQPYNQVTSIDGFSQALFRVSDATTIFGRPVTIVQITRNDRAREWARSGSSHGLFPLPYKEDRASLGVVTSTEIALVEELKTQIPGTMIRYFVLQDLYKYNEDVRMKMQEAVGQFEKR